ncbi:hypothetical protein BY996DRAFT_6449955 [Phakopsora pachyrhizi]|nr:hypothetical protein BY996DRAFT_6449955 [Phakopsora pachyrhizi]
MPGLPRRPFWNFLKKVEGLLKYHQSKLESKMSLFNQTTEAEETDQAVELAREEHEGWKEKLKQAKETRPIEDPMTPGLEGNQGEGGQLPTDKYKPRRH